MDIFRRGRKRKQLEDNFLQLSGFFYLIALYWVGVFPCRTHSDDQMNFLRGVWCKISCGIYLWEHVGMLNNYCCLLSLELHFLIFTFLSSNHFRETIKNLDLVVYQGTPNSICFFPLTGYKSHNFYFTSRKWLIIPK